MHSRELERIRWILSLGGRPEPAGSGRVVIGNGDDAAVWIPPPGAAAVLTVDAQVEGIHFLPGWLTPGEIGARAVAASASDLAAMAARPGGILLAITLPREVPESFFRALYRGALGEARREGLTVLGGNLSAGALTVTVTAVGSVRPAEAVSRSGGRPRDGLYVTGWPGRSSIGLALLRARRKPAASNHRAALLCRRAFASPRPRLSEACALARLVRPRAMVDLSDGLCRDLSHLLGAGVQSAARASRGHRLGAALFTERLEALLLEGGCAALSRSLGLDPLAAALHGGEDYELLFAADPLRVDPILARFRARFGIPLTRIGTVESRPGLRAGGKEIRARGFDHFG